MIVAKNGKRGFINRHTAQIVLPYKYDAAWSFSDGVAGVCRNDMVYFIDHSGHPIHSHGFKRVKGYDNYAYHGNYAANPVGNKYGLIDREGKWALSPKYEKIYVSPKNMWRVKYNGKWGAYSDDGKFIIPTEYSDVLIHYSNGITVTKADNSRSRYDYDGTLLDGMVFDEIYYLTYYINDFDNEGNQKKAADRMLKYCSGRFYGLMTKDGVAVTPPLYSEIEVVSPGVYQCHIPGSGGCIMVDGEGKKINP